MKKMFKLKTLMVLGSKWSEGTQGEMFDTKMIFANWNN
jgi:hypothetical protein